MILTITTTHRPATDLGYLLHKHPDKFQTFDLSLGKAHIFYPESTEERTTVALLLDIDPIDMVRGRGRNLSGKGFALAQYVNDRPYVASSFMSVAIAKTLSTAMNGRCTHRPELIGIKMPFEAKLSALPAPRGGEDLIKRLFEPLGYAVELEQHQLDEQFTEWGMSKYFSLTLRHEITIADLLSHLYVLIPVLDNDKHYYVSNSEIEKLLEKGKGWLENHPMKEEITHRYLINLRSLSKQALARLSEGEEAETSTDEEDQVPELKEKKKGLHRQRLETVLEHLKSSGAESVVDLGCGEGKLLRMLMKERQFKKIAGMDVVYKELEKAKEKIYWDRLAPKQKERVQLFQGSLTYRDERLAGFDAAAIVEVIEHLDSNRLKAFERVVFEFAKPKKVVLTTPNGEYNALFENMEPGKMRHSDHRFEWSRAEFQAWGNRVAEAYGYSVSYHPIGDVDETYGPITQMGVFSHGN